MKFLIILFIYCLPVFGSSQKAFRYKCSSLNNKRVQIKTVIAKKALQYQGKKVFITKYNIVYDKKVLTSFYGYTYANKLHLVDGKIMKLNHTKDPVIFSIPKQEMYSIQLSGILSNTQLYLNSFVSINNKTFYKYMLESIGQPIYISEIIFDEKLYIDEIRLKHGNSTCKCTKSDIVVELK